MVSNQLFFSQIFVFLLLRIRKAEDITNGKVKLDKHGNRASWKERNCLSPMGHRTFSVVLLWSDRLVVQHHGDDPDWTGGAGLPHRIPGHR